MIWRVVVVVICIIIVVSAVWAASDSFEVRVDSPNAFGDHYTIPTPTPVPVPVNYPFPMEIGTNKNGTASIYIDMPLPTTHVVLMKGNRVNQLERFHLCRGTLTRCNGGIESSDANYIDWQGDGLADRLRVYFSWEDFKTLLSTSDPNTGGTNSTEPSSADPTSAQGVATFGATINSNGVSTATTSGSSATLVDSSTDRKRTIHLTISGDLYAWKIAKP